MPEFIRWLLHEPLVLLILVSWIFSMIGGVMQRAAKKAQAERQRTQRPDAPRDVTASGRPPQQPSPDDIAREIRRAMGLEREPGRAPPRLPQQQEAPRPAKPAGVGGAEPPRRIDYDEMARPAARSVDSKPPRPPSVSDEARPRQGLREEMQAKAVAAAQRAVDDDARRDRHLGDAVRERHLDLHVGGGAKARRRAAPRAGGRLDLSRPAAAIVAMEVLGPPIALRRSPMPHDV